jgi:hypothetical protein
VDGMRAVSGLQQQQQQPSFPFAQRLLVDTRHAVVYCDVPKIASSTVKTAMAVMTGQLPMSFVGNVSRLKLLQVPVHTPTFMRSIGLSALGGMGPRNGTEILFNINSSKATSDTLRTGANWIDEEPFDLVYVLRSRRYRKFIVVRHPFDRVVSAYRDKFVKLNRWTSYFHRKYGRLIVARYRTNSSTAVERSSPPTRSFAVPQLIATANVSTVRQPVTKVGNADAGHDVTFVEFVRFLIDDAPEIRTFKTNPHWQPVSELCQPCTVGYDYVVRIETFELEMAALWNELYPSSTQFLSALSQSVLKMRRNRYANDDIRSVDRSSSGGASTGMPADRNDAIAAVTSRYLQQLTNDQLCRLAEVYRKDFEFFGYQANVNCSSNSSLSGDDVRH